jgi:phosphatidylglycerol:prolipoprotein diacylglycerol transferase
VGSICAFPCLPSRIQPRFARTGPIVTRGQRVTYRQEGRLLMLAYITIGISPVAFAIGPFAVHWYGLGYVLGIAVATWVIVPYARERGVTEDQIWTTLTWTIVAGLVGGRLYFVVQNGFGSFLRSPLDIFAIWQGGMAFYGAIFAVVLVILYLHHRRGYPLWALLDAGSLFAVLGQAFGRLGNIVNGDIVGYPTRLPWGTIYTNPLSLAPELGVAYQPAAAYELIFNLCFFALLYSLRHRLRPGWLFVTYIAGYSVGQFALFFLRANSVLALGLKQAQWTAIIVLLADGAFALWLRRQPPSVDIAPPTEVGIVER